MIALRLLFCRGRGVLHSPCLSTLTQGQRGNAKCFCPVEKAKGAPARLAWRVEGKSQEPAPLPFPFVDA